ncbi:hypothetical protein PAP_02280 [Palaeococcus pacificus DY20341]|uniref:Transglutaminase-like domain-containing protein n=1 Tax=Palaeococcus pacificus DY20341 TaxID=1343739 RepID=A0A075LRZ2_9EURY|nr:transglutaminase-like domain-containing protein [Palaeococcus pacificus]AIF68886.1 hypothetical protein PAP_02280 [Palaeococcus pacificus DY20341]
MNTKWAGIIGLILLLLTIPVEAKEVQIGVLEKEYIVLSTASMKLTNTGINIDVPITTFYAVNITTAYYTPLKDYKVTYAVYEGQRKIIWAPPMNSSKLIPKYNDSVYLPEDLKNITKELAETSDTIAEFAWKVSWFVHTNITYSDQRFSAERRLIFDFDKYHQDKLLQEIWQKKKGVCRHKALLMVRMLEYVGVEAEYVGGYALATIQGEHEFIPSEELDTISELIKFSTHTGFGHAWVLVHDPNVGWYPLDPTRQRDPLHPIRYDNIAVYKGEYKAFAPDSIPMFRLEKLADITSDVNAVRYRNVKIIESNNTGIIVYNPKKGQIDYLQGGYAWVVPQYFNWSFENEFESVSTTSIDVYHYNNKYYVKIGGIQLPLYFTRKNRVVNPITKEGEYYVYEDLLVIRGKAYFSTPFYVLVVPVIEGHPPGIQ